MTIPIDIINCLYSIGHFTTFQVNKVMFLVKIAKSLSSKGLELSLCESSKPLWNHHGLNQDS